jgi:hypothetical protein
VRLGSPSAESWLSEEGPDHVVSLTGMRRPFVLGIAGILTTRASLTVNGRRETEAIGVARRPKIDPGGGIMGATSAEEVAPAVGRRVIAP